jgi:outer membrane protein OmpA-like peptidoglycan-associated protein/tetratricopeptide (TPR) repeat protein
MRMLNLYIGCLFLWITPIWSQTWEEKGHKQFQELAYSDAIFSLEKAVEKGKSANKIYVELGDAYYFNANYQASAKWYQLRFKSSEYALPIHFYRFAQSLKSIGKYEKAEEILKQMSTLFPKESARFSAVPLPDYEAKRIKNSGRYKIELVSFNSVAADFGPSYYGKQIVFASARDTGSVFKRSHSWTNQSFTDLYRINPDSASSKPIRLGKEINSKFNESTAVFTRDGLTMYFTRNNFENKKRGTDENQTTLLKIYKAEKKEDNWKVMGALPFCSDAFNVAHPALSANEKTMYFASDMPGGFGQSDLYEVALHSDGSFGKPENLGASVNTFGRETVPFVSSFNELYFASDGHDGFGGLDVFVSNLDENAKYVEPQNVGKPINSRMDDFGFISNAENNSGFFTSNRSGGGGMDDIYAFKELVPMPSERILEGSVSIENEVDLRAGIEIILLDANSNAIGKTTTDEKGKYCFKVDAKYKYAVQTVLKSYVSQIISAQPSAFSITTLPTIRIVREQMNFQAGDDLVKKLSLNPIYFDLSKSNIRQDAALELAKIKKVLEDYPTLTIEVRSHTDSRDTSENNQILSNQRAVATVNWFIESGIDSKRLKGIGYGETQLLNPCADAIPCSESEHQLNRRSAFIVTGI